MSAEANLAGLFPPTDTQIWNENLMWQPIPVHTIPSETDYLLHVTRQCDRFDYLLTDYLNEDDRLDNLLKDFWPIFDIIKKETGQEKWKLMGILTFYDTLYVEKSRGFQ